MIKFITSFLSLLWVLLAGTSTENKVRLAKQPTKTDDFLKVSRWYDMNSDFIALAAILILLGLFILFCFICCGVSAVESGTMYNHLGGVI